MTNFIMPLMHRRFHLAWAVLLICLGAGAIAAMMMRTQAQDLARTQLGQQADAVVLRLHERLLQQQQMLVGAAGMVDAVDTLTPAKWQRYVQRLGATRQEAGLQEMGLSLLITSAGLPAHRAAVRAAGTPQYRVWPPGERAAYAPIVFLTPLTEQNRPGIGLDLLADETRAAVMTQAIETGSTVMTERQSRVQAPAGNASAEFVMIVPVYDRRLPHSTPQERVRAATGFVFSPFDLTGLMQGLTGKPDPVLDIVIADHLGKNRLYQGHPAAGSGAAQAPLRAVRNLTRFGQTWVVAVSPRIGSDGAVEPGLQQVAPLFGGSLMIVLGVLVGLWGTRKARARDRALAAVRAVRETGVRPVGDRDRNTQQAEALIHALRSNLYERDRHLEALNVHAIVSVTDIDGNLTYVNDRFCSRSGYSREELLGQQHRMFKSGKHAPEFYAQLWRTITANAIWSGILCNQNRDGEHYWIESSIVPFVDDTGALSQYIMICTDVTQLERNKEAWRISEERFRLGQSFANIGTWDWTIETGELLWSECIGPMFGYTEDKSRTTYDQFITAVHPDDRQRVSDAIMACVDSDTHYESEHRIIWSDGTMRWLLERGAVIRDDAGKATHMLGMVQDIHERKMVELALLSSEKRLMEAQFLARLGHWELDIATDTLFWSEMVYQIFGRDSATFEASTAAFREAVHPQDRELVTESEQRAIETGIHDVVHRIVRPDGTIRTVHEQARLEHNAEGKLWRLSGTVLDMTEYMETKEQLRESEERFIFAVEGAGDGIWDMRLETGVMLLSGHAETMLGYERGEIPATIEAGMASVHPADLPMVKSTIKRYLAGTASNYTLELRLRCKDGSYKWILCRGTVVARDAQEKPVRMIGIHTDISEQKQVQAALVEARENAERANMSKSDFLSSMSHELRTPMNAILGFAQIMEYDSSLPEEHKDNVHEILKGGHHLLELINEVLDLGKIESGNVNVSLEAVILADVLRDCQQLIQPLLTTRQLRFDMSLFPEMAVKADRTRLKQVLLNLLSNAAKYNRTGGMVSIQVLPIEDQRLRILVADTGIGIAPHHVPNLFQPFNRLGAQLGNIEGSGIGLTITRKLVELMGGTVGVESELGVGSRFWIDLPGVAVTRPGLTTLQPAHRGIVHAGVARQQVLLIDDNPVNGSLIAKILGLRPYVDLMMAQTPGLGIELAKAHRPAVILLDINMPDMDGYAVFKVLRADPALASTPIIAVTANAMPNDIARGMAAGFSAYLTKPLDIGVFLHTIDGCLTGPQETPHDL